MNKKKNYRNNNYYLSIIKEFFVKDSEKIRKKLIENLDKDNIHVCMCNMCGGDINVKSE